MFATWAFVIGLALFGFAFLLLELFILPGFGVAGIIGIAGIIGSIYVASQRLGLVEATILFAAMFILALLAIVRATTSGAVSKLRNESISPGKTFDDKDTGVPLPKVGATGVAMTPLHPSGIIRIDGQRYDVIADGSIIEEGAAVEVIEVMGSVIKVRAI